MSALIRKVHIYAGLAVFTQLLVYGMAGLLASMHTSGERAHVPHSIRYVAFERAPGETDAQTAARVYEELRPPLSRPVPQWAFRKTPDGHLLLDFYNINGITRATVLENEHRLKVESIRNSTTLFLEDIHAATLGDEGQPALMKVWSAWNEAGMWALLFFCVSGVWLWLATSPRNWWAWATLVLSGAAFVCLWKAFR